jgi:Glycosyl transferases group 1
VRRRAAADPAVRLVLPSERGDVPDLLPAFDIFTLPSRYEGLPTVIVEAMMCGVPVVATAVNAVGDVVVPGETGVLVPPPAARSDGRFYWVNHTYTHAYLGCKQDFTVVPWKCETSGGSIVWAAGTGLINSQILDNFAWARKNGIPAEPGVLATGEYSGLRILPQQPVDNPCLDNAMAPDKIKWVAMDASREPAMRSVGAALGVPRHPIDVGYDADGGSGICQGSKTTRCLAPLNPRTGWDSYIVPGQVQIIVAAMLTNDPRSFFMHQSNLTGDRLGYAVMDGVLSAYRAVYGVSAPIVNLPMSGGGAALHDQSLWGQGLHTGAVSAWVQGSTVTISGPPGTLVPATMPAATTGPVPGADFGSPYAGERSAYVTLGSQPLHLTLSSAPFPAVPKAG